MKTSALFFGLLALTLMSPVRSGQAAESSTFITIFDEQFATDPHERFKTIPLPVPGQDTSEGSYEYDKDQKARSLSGHLALIRPVRAGAKVRLDLQLQFNAPDAKAPAQMITSFKFVLFDQSVAGVEIERSKQTNVPARVRFVHESAGQPSAKVLREITLKDTALDGEWHLGYCHGLLTLQHGEQQIGGACMDKLGVQVAGVSWAQKGGKVTCKRMTLTGEPLHETSPTDQETLHRASLLNQE